MWKHALAQYDIMYWDILGFGNFLHWDVLEFEKNDLLVILTRILLCDYHLLDYSEQRITATGQLTPRLIKTWK